MVLHPGRGVHITSADGDFGLRIGLRAQLRATVAAPARADASLDFAVRRARLNLSGHFFGEENRFAVQLAFSPEDLGLTDAGLAFTPLLDYVVELHYLRDLEVVVGQNKRPFSRERITSSGTLSLVDRSIVDSELTLDRDLGFFLRSQNFLGLEWLRYYAGISTGEGRDGGPGEDLGFLYFARVELLPVGLFDDHTQADFSRSAAPRLSVGLAYAFDDDAPRMQGLDGDRPEDGGTTDYHHAALDLLLLWSGFTLEADLLVRWGERNPGGALDPLGVPLPVTPPRNGLGWFVQISYLVPEIDLEIGARHGMNIALGADTSFPDEGELGGGVAYYFAEHALSLHLDWFHLWTDDFEGGDERVRLQLEAIL